MRTKRQNPGSEADGKWAGCRETKPRLRSRQKFFLDIPFDRTSLLIELIDPPRAVLNLLEVLSAYLRALKSMRKPPPCPIASIGERLFFPFSPTWGTGQMRVELWHDSCHEINLSFKTGHSEGRVSPVVQVCCPFAINLRIPH